MIAKETCQHPPTRLYSWYAFDGTLCVCCNVCGAVLRGSCDEVDYIWQSSTPATRKSMLRSSGAYPFLDIDITVEKDWKALSPKEKRAISKAWDALAELSKED